MAKVSKPTLSVETKRLRASLVQARRLEHLAQVQLDAWGGESAVIKKKPDAVEGEGEV